MHMSDADLSAPSIRTLVYEKQGLFTRRTAEIDPLNKRLRLIRRRFGRWTTTIVDCSLDQCIAVGTIEYSTDGHTAYGTYFKLKNGSWYAIPLHGHSFKEALAVVRQVSAATGIPRLDVKYS
jgi:hypothetical protein